MIQHIKKITLTSLLSLFLVNNAYCIDNLRDIVDRNGYHYYRGSDAPDRHVDSGYYNNTGYYTYASPLEGRDVYLNSYNNYNNGYYNGGFYGNAYYHNGYYNNGYYNPGNCFK